MPDETAISLFATPSTNYQVSQLTRTGAAHGSTLILAARMTLAQRSDSALMMAAN